ncbi:MAG: hypothetical protein H3C26_16050 [Rhodocyclaceae bacterium]|nr:hypothetical protein [Rhodocyclaceae bacterium]
MPHLIAMHRGKGCPIQAELNYERWPDFGDDDGSLQASARHSFRVDVRPGIRVFDGPLDAPEIVPDGSMQRTEDHFAHVIKFLPRERVLPRDGGWRE